jgi:DNA polymerase-3 subunit delta
MTTLAYQELDRHLAAPQPPAPLYLVFGEEMLCQEAVQAIVARLLGPSAPAHRVDRIDGSAPGALAEALARVNTYSLLGDAKVVLLAETTVFETGLDTRAYLEKARSALENDAPDKAARALMAVLAAQQLTVAEVDAEARRHLLATAGMDTDNDGWLEALVDHCRSRDAASSSTADQAESLAEAAAKGFPAGHHLIVTAASVDRRRKIYKVIEAAGVVVDASVPTGARRADVEVQQRLLRDQVQRILAPRAKRLEPAAHDALVEMTGFELRTFCTSLEKLADYAGSRDTITAEDVRQVLRRSKKDPIYAFTGAVGERRLDQALFYLDSLLTAGTHPLQVLAALANLVRRLAAARGFLDSPEGRCWRRRMPYPEFQRQVVPALSAHDAHLAERVRSWRGEAEAETGKSKRSAKAETDLALVKNPKSVYPVYQLFLQAENYRAAHLEAVLHRLARTDRALKSSAAPARWTIEALLWFICQGGESKPHRGTQPPRPANADARPRAFRR